MSKMIGYNNIGRMRIEHQRIFNFLLSKMEMNDKKLLLQLIELEHQLTKRELREE